MNRIRSTPRDNMFRDRQFCRDLLRLTAPIALQSLMLAAVAAADALMLGSSSQNDMAAVSLATQIQFVQNMALSSGVSGFAILAAQYWGKGDRAAVSQVFFMALRFCLVISVVTFVGCVFFPQYLMLLFTDEQALIDIGAMPEGARFYGSVSGDFANRDKVMRYLKGVLEVIDLRGQNAVFSRMFRTGQIKAGDIFLCDGHTFVYGGNKMFYACGHDAEWHSDPSAPTEDPSHAVFEKWDVRMQGNSNYSHSINFILRIRDDYVPRYYRNKDGVIVRNPDKNRIE